MSRSPGRLENNEQSGSSLILWGRAGFVLAAKILYPTALVAANESYKYGCQVSCSRVHISMAAKLAVAECI